MASTYPSIHFSLDEDTLEITVGCLVCGVVCVVCCVLCVHVVLCVVLVVCVYMWCCVWCWWCVCVHVVLCVVLVVVFVCVVLLWWCVCVVCGEAWHTLSLSLLLSLLPLPPANSVLHVPLPLSATTTENSSSAIVGTCEQSGKQSINQKCF